MADTSQTRSEAASPRRREDARKRGQFASSTELSSGLILLFVLILLSRLGPVMGSALIELFQDSASTTGSTDVSLAFGVGLGRAGIMFFLTTVAALNVGSLLISIASYVLQIGFNVSSETIEFRPSRMLPTNGLKRLFSLKGLMRTALAILKFLTVTTVFATAIAFTKPASLLSSANLHDQIGSIWDMTMTTSMLAALTVVSIGGIDYAFQRWQHEKELMMTKQEVKDESRETDGDPRLKSRMRKLQVEAGKMQSIADVPNADVVITNPTHYSVALKYERGSKSAPRVLSKGVDRVARMIRHRARDAGVPIVEKPEVARAIYASTKIGEEIPVNLYRAVAEILAGILKVRR